MRVKFIDELSSVITFQLIYGWSDDLTMDLTKRILLHVSYLMITVERDHRHKYVKGHLKRFKMPGSHFEIYDY